jgi:vitellogenic carboxypeptidase-like protein
MGHLLFIDSPLNVGFSFQGKDRTGKNQVSTTEDAAKHLLNFLFRFFHGASTTVFRNSPVYIIGESFAGHYIPELAEQILSNQSFLRNTGMKLVGISIGDGWTDPINQVNYYDSYLWSVGVVE